MSDDTAPARIWLNTAGSYSDAYEAAIGTETGVTWCDMRQDERDQEYVRADLGSFYQERDIDGLMACRDALRRLVDAQDCGAPDTDPIHLRLWHDARVALGYIPADLEQRLAEVRAGVEGEE